VLDAIVKIEISQVECVLPVVFLQHICSVIGHKKAEAWREVVGSSDLVWKFVKSNIFAVMWEDAWPERKYLRGWTTVKMASHKAHRGLPSHLMQDTNIDYHPPSERHTQAIFLSLPVFPRG
jgi:hypothetical protein